jgi:glycosyltransferase involved in cell wall biosynthesis
VSIEVHRDNLEWAHGRTNQTLRAALPDCELVVNDYGPCDTYLTYNFHSEPLAKCRRAVLVVGGMADLELTFGDELLEEGGLTDVFAPFDTIVTKCARHALVMRRHHRDVREIPNALDLDHWHPVQRPARPPVAGFAGNIGYNDRKGYTIARDACREAGMRLVAVGIGLPLRLPLDQMRDGFYRHIDVLVAPTVTESCSYAISEALATGAPVVTTEGAAFHVERGSNSACLRIVPRTVEAVAAALASLTQGGSIPGNVRACAASFVRRHLAWPDALPLWRSAILGS